MSQIYTYVLDFEHNCNPMKIEIDAYSEQEARNIVWKLKENLIACCCETCKTKSISEISVFQGPYANLCSLNKQSEYSILNKSFSNFDDLIKFSPLKKINKPLIRIVTALSG